MGLMQILSFMFGGKNAVKETIEVFRPNAEANAQRVADYKNAALHQYAAEFHARSNRNWVDSLVDALNRLIRPVVTLMVLYPLYATVYDPIQMANVWQAIATLPQGYWAVAGLVLSFYFGGRMQIKALDSSSLASSATALAALSPPVNEGDEEPVDSNPALDEWRKIKGEKK